MPTASVSEMTSEITQLSAAERIQLAQDIWDNLAADPDSVSLSPAQAEGLDRRLSAYRSAPAQGASWHEVQHRVRGRQRPLCRFPKSFQPPAEAEIAEAFAGTKTRARGWVRSSCALWTPAFLLFSAPLLLTQSCINRQPPLLTTPLPPGYTDRCHERPRYGRKRGARVTDARGAVGAVVAHFVDIEGVTSSNLVPPTILPGSRQNTGGGFVFAGPHG